MKARSEIARLIEGDPELAANAERIRRQCRENLADQIKACETAEQLSAEDLSIVINAKP